MTRNEQRILLKVAREGVRLRRVLRALDDDFPQVLRDFDDALREARPVVEGAYRAEVSFTELCEVNELRAVEWQGEPTDPEKWALFASNELGGEAGELQNVVKKYERFLRDMPGGHSYAQARPRVAEELADVIICASRVAQCFEINLGYAVLEKFNSTSDRYGLEVKL